MEGAEWGIGGVPKWTTQWFPTTPPHPSWIPQSSVDEEATLGSHVLLRVSSATMKGQRWGKEDGGVKQVIQNLSTSWVNIMILREVFELWSSLGTFQFLLWPQWPQIHIITDGFLPFLKTYKFLCITSFYFPQFSLSVRLKDKLYLDQTDSWAHFLESLFQITSGQNVQKAVRTW